MDNVDKLAWAYPPTEISSYCSASWIFYHNTMFLRALGVLPIKATLTPSSDVGQRHKIHHYTFAIKSFAFLYCSILASFIVIVWGLFLAESTSMNVVTVYKFSNALTGPTALNNSTLEKTTSSEVQTLDVAQHFFHMLFPITSCFQLLYVFIKASEFSTYVNTWTRFEERFRHIFTTRHPFLNNEPIFPGTIWFRKSANIFTLVLVALVGLTIYPLIHGQEQNSPNGFAVKTFAWLFMVLGFSTVFINIMIDLRSNLMLFMNAEAFSQIELKIIQQIEKLQSGSKLNASIVQDWQELISFAKRQAVSFGKLMSVPLFMELTNFFSTWCSITFQTIVFAKKGGLGLDSLKNIAPSYLVCFFTYIRFAFKIFFAEKLLRSEAKISKFLRVLDFSNRNDLDLATSLEINMIIDWIDTTPSKINISNVFVLDRRLLLSVVGQTVTYVLVLLQFQYLQGP